MANPSGKSVIVVGGGIVGLSVAVAAQAAGHAVTLIARDRPEDTASGIAAGMIAPALEAMNDPDPAMSFCRLSEAQDAWFDLFDLWPEDMRTLLADAQWRGDTLYYVPRQASQGELAQLQKTGAETNWLDWEGMAAAGFDPETCSLLRVTGDWLVEAAALLPALQSGLAPEHRVTGDVADVSARAVRLATGEIFEADEVIVAAGFEGRALAGHIPSLARLAPIKGHLLDIGGVERYGVTRSANGYYAGYGGRGKFGASMQEDQADLAVEPAIVADLKTRARALDLDTNAAIPRTGVRAASPDGWPMIGRDAASGVLMATAMRRNGFVFAPLAARMLLAFLSGETPPEAESYDPNRFG